MNQQRQRKRHLAGSRRIFHLPEVPTAAEVEKKGIDLGESQVMLLKKIEELTLYVIDQHKEQNDQRKKLLELTGWIQKLEKENKRLKKLVRKKLE